MATFVELTPDPFNKVNAAVSQVQGQTTTTDGSGNKIGLYDHVRRPVRGIQIKDETHATIQVRKADGTPIPLFDAAGQADNAGFGHVIRNSNFLLQGIQEQRAEKQQIVMTFGEPYIFFFGEQPRVISVSGVLLNTEDFNWRAEWWENYDKHLRGTQCVRSKSRVYLSWDDIVVEGYIMQANASEDTQAQHLVQFQFQMFLTNYQNISNIGSGTAHYDFKPDLQPELAAFQRTLGTGTSRTLEVRNRNLRAAQLSDGFGLDSLLGVLTGSISLGSGGIGFSAAGVLGTDIVADVKGQVVNILAEAGRFVSGRNIRVPLGFEGSVVFDDAQIALASIPNAEAVITGEERTVAFGRVFAGVDYIVQGVLGARTGPARTGLPLSANEDEFIARSHNGAWDGGVPVTELYATQVAEDEVLGAKIADTFRAHGIEVEPPSELMLLATRGVFGIVSVGAGAFFNEANTANPDIGFGANISGALLGG